VRALLTTVILLLAAGAETYGAQSSLLIYPSGATVPENLLRIELRFSTPIWPPFGIENLKLFEASGVEIKDAFYDLPLPSADGKRLTILFHPGRIKSGVGPNLVLGRALHAGDEITLVVDHPELAKAIRKTWRVTAFDAESPQPRNWIFETPKAGSLSPLVLHLDKAISSSAESLIAIRGPDGRRLAGVTCLENSETVWRFVPARPWQVGNYAVVTHPDLEDCAGNRPCVPFESFGASRVADEQGTVLPFQLSTVSSF
jgi:hypothetical protein